MARCRLRCLGNGLFQFDQIKNRKEHVETVERTQPEAADRI